MELSGYCKTHDEREPHFWPYEELGLWICPSCAKKNRATNEEINNAIKKIINSEQCENK